MSKKRLILVAVLLLAVLGALWLIKILSTGSVTITTNKKDSVIFLVKGGSDNEEAREQVGKDSAKIRLKPGTYTVVAKNGEAETKTVVSVVVRKNTAKIIELVDPAAPRLVASYSAYSPIKSGAIYRFLNKPLSQIYQFSGSAREPRGIFSDLFPVAKISWVNFSTGLVQQDDGALIAIIKNKPVYIKFPAGTQSEFDAESYNYSSYSVNEHGQMIMLIGDKLYFYSSLSDMNPVVVTDGLDPDSIVKLSRAGLAVVVHDVFSGVDTGSKENFVPSFFNVRTKKQLDVQPPNIGNTVSVQWSPDGQKLLYSSFDGVNVFDFKKRSHRLLSTLLPNNSDAAIWLDNKSVLLIDNSQLWRSSIDSQDLYKAAINVGAANHEDAVRVTNNGKKLLLSTTAQGALGSGLLYEVDLN